MSLKFPFDTRAFLATVPHLPGVYRMIGVDEKLLYVGKAKDLKKRLSSYFNKSTQTSPRTVHMLSHVQRVEFTVTGSESEALLLENNLIKAKTPRYNILFRDDKSYPFLKITRHCFPRITYYRGPIDRRHQYFGPFPNAQAVRDSVHILQKVFQIRTCQESVFSNRSRPCMLHQIERCSAPCVGKISAEHYDADVQAAIRFLRGDHRLVLSEIEEKMHAAAAALRFEEASVYRDRITTLSGVLQQQDMETTTDRDVDVLVAVQQGTQICVNVAMVRSGRHLGDTAFFPKHMAEASNAETLSEILSAFIAQHYDGGFIPHVLVVDRVPPITPLVAWLSQQTGYPVQWIHKPQNTQRRWLESARQNAQIALIRRCSETVSQSTQTRTLVDLILGFSESEQQHSEGKQKDDVALLEDDFLESFRIECFDISHTSGEGTVGSAVVYHHHTMQPTEYRRYNITGVTPGDDYAAMEQVLFRHYQRWVPGNIVLDSVSQTKNSVLDHTITKKKKLDPSVEILSEKNEITSGQTDSPEEILLSKEKIIDLGRFPNLVLIDGGIGHLEVAKKVFLSLGLQVSVLVAVSKGEGRKVGLETLIFGDGRPSIAPGLGSLALLLIAKIRDEAHRFAITGMRARRAKKRQTSLLEEIPGVGKTRRQRLLVRFGGIQGLKSAGVDEIASVSGISKGLAQQIYLSLHSTGP